MKKHNTPKRNHKLALNRETLRLLDKSVLGDAAGAIPASTGESLCYTECETDFCKTHTCC